MKWSDRRVRPFWMRTAARTGGSVFFVVVETGETFWRFMVVEQQSWAEEAVQGNDAHYQDKVVSIMSRAGSHTVIEGN